MSESSVFKCLALVAAIAALQGCGGGGGGGGGGFPLAFPAGDASAPQEESKPPEAAEPESTAPQTDRYAPVAGSEPAPSLSTPQTGSTADVGSASEGIFQSMYGYTFIDPKGNFAQRGLTDWTWGSIAVSDNNWSFDSRTRAYFIDVKPVSGSGTFTPKTSMEGTYSVDGRASSAWGPLKYSLSNALAITPESLQGKWSSTETSSGTSFEFDSNGVFSGATSGTQFGVCKLSGVVTQVEPGTAKNMFYLEMTAINAATASEKACTLDTSLPYAGFAGVVLTPAGMYAQNGYFRTFAFNAMTENLYLLTSYLRKEQ